MRVGSHGDNKNWHHNGGVTDQYHADRMANVVEGGINGWLAGETPTGVTVTRQWRHVAATTTMAQHRRIVLHGNEKNRTL